MLLPPTRWALYTRSKCMICLFLMLPLLFPPTTLWLHRPAKQLTGVKSHNKRWKDKEITNSILDTSQKTHSYLVMEEKSDNKNLPRKGGWRRPFHSAGPSCNPQPSCSAAVLEGIWRRGPGKTPHTSFPGRSARWSSLAPLLCESRKQKEVSYTQTPHWIGENQKWMVECQVCCPEMDYVGTGFHLCLSVSLWEFIQPLKVVNIHSACFSFEVSPQ